MCESGSQRRDRKNIADLEGTMKKMFLMSIIFSIVPGLLWYSPSMGQETRITIGATGTSSGFYVYFVAMGNAIKTHDPQIIPTVIETGGGTDNADRLMRKQIHCGLGNNMTAYQAYMGQGKWEGKPYKEMRGFWSYTDPGPLDILVRQDSGVNSIHDLTGKKFCPGARGSGNEKMIENVFNLLNIKPDYYRGDFSDAAEAVERGQVVGLTKFSAAEKIGDAQVMSIGAKTKIKFLSISEGDLKKIREAFPFLGLASHPPNVYKDQNYEVRGFSPGASIVITATHVPPELGYRICKAIWKGRDIQGNAYPAFKEIDPFKLAAKDSIVPMHAGMVKFCKELGIGVPEKLIPPEYQ